ncbi:MAG: Lar family restriction alleviation protein [Synergistaceae bacterium]|nr:Lar family restriction alleviation protein [Synergistaceae bacterium]
MSEELKPCPFCGGEAEVCADENEEYFVSCTKCTALFGYCTDTWGEYETEAAAIEAWNRRVSK